MTLAERLSSHKAACTSCSRTNCKLQGRAALLVRRGACLDHRNVVHSDVRGGDVVVTEAVSPRSDDSEPIREELVKTRYIAETLLPTRHGAFRLRGYKHSVSSRPGAPPQWQPSLHHTQCDQHWAGSDFPRYALQLDGGTTFTEPTAIICGHVEGQSNVSCLSASTWMGLLFALHRVS